jgi:hypothetical protein
LIDAETRVEWFDDAAKPQIEATIREEQQVWQNEKRFWVNTV